MSHEKTPLETPVTFLIFNRPDVTERVFASIAEARPQTLLVVCDGPREDREGEAELVEATRAIIDRVDWPCQVLKNYSDLNLGCGRRIASGLDWVFQNVETSIILEDDCLPHSDFFPYCETLLRTYENEPRIGCIGGNNFQDGQASRQHSYYFSKYFHCWGWATWRRAWRDYDFTMRSWPAFRDRGGLRELCDTPEENWYWTRVFDRQYQGLCDTWDYQWTYCCWSQSRLSIVPSVNLVSNIGFGADATHTTHSIDELAELPTEPLPVVSHPTEVARDRYADQYTFQRNFLGRRGRGLRKYLTRLRSYFQLVRLQRAA